MRDRGGDVALGRAEGLAVVERLELGELGAVCLQQVGERVHQPAALRRRELSHRPVERLAGRADGAVDVGGAGVGEGDDRLARGGIDGLERAPVGGLHGLTTDQQPQRPRVDELPSGVGCQL